MGYAVLWKAGGTRSLVVCCVGFIFCSREQDGKKAVSRNWHRQELTLPTLSCFFHFDTVFQTQMMRATNEKHVLKPGSEDMQMLEMIPSKARVIAEALRKPRSPCFSSCGRDECPESSGTLTVDW